MYAAQGMRNKWYGMLGADFVEESDEDQDSLKVEILCQQVLFSFRFKKEKMQLRVSLKLNWRKMVWLIIEDKHFMSICTVEKNC